MARTRQELAVAVMQHGGWLSAEQTPSAEDAALIKAAYDDKLEYLTDEGLVYWSADEIPNAVFTIVRDLMINEVGAAFGEAQPLEQKQDREDYIVKKLRRHMARNPSGARTAAEYF